MNDKLHPLEAARGVAAFAVLFNHFFLAFLPRLHGALPGFRDADSLVGTWAFVFMNGMGAVTFFFVLSGYVLTLRYFKTEKIDLMLVGIVKRLPRLAGPVLIAVMLSCALFQAHWYSHPEAAALSMSPWLLGFGFSGVPADFDPSWLQAFKEGIWRAFIHGEVLYNSNLWTMAIELKGSWMVFVLAPILATLVSPRWRGVAAVIMLVGAIVVKVVLASFIAGMLMAYWHAHSSSRLRTPLALVMSVVALYLLGYITPSPTYAWVDWLTRNTAETWFQPRSATLIHTFASCLLVHVLIRHGRTNLALQGPLSQWLGKLSFPVYLLQLPILFSVSSWLYVELGSHPAALLANLVLTVVATILVSIPLALFDKRWVAAVNRTFGLIIGNLKLGFSRVQRGWGA